MKKRVFVIAALVSGALAVSGCTTNPYTGESEAGKSGIGAGLGSLVGAGVGALSSSKKDRGKGALIGAAAGAFETRHAGPARAPATPRSASTPRAARARTRPARRWLEPATRVFIYTGF